MGIRRDCTVHRVPGKQVREHTFLTKSPEENYRELAAESPGLVQRLTQNDTARYLGITPVVLSRIRGRLRQRDR